MFAEGSDYQGGDWSPSAPRARSRPSCPAPLRFWNFDLGPQPVPHLIVSPHHPRARAASTSPSIRSCWRRGDHNGATYYQHRRFLDTVRTGRKPEVTLQDGAMAVRMGLAAQEAALTGKAVTL